MVLDAGDSVRIKSLHYSSVVVENQSCGITEGTDKHFEEN